MILTQLPPEIIHHVLGYVDPSDLGWIPRISKSFYHAVTGNASLFRVVYLRHLDTPCDGRQVNFEQALKDVVRLKVICCSGNVDDKKSELQFVHDTTTAILKNAATGNDRARLSATYKLSRNASLLAALFADPVNQSAFLCRSLIYERARGEFRPGEFLQNPPRPEHQMSAHLHCLYGAPLLYASPGAHPQTRSGDMRPFACSVVYDLRQYTDRTRWGPFTDDGTDRVDWEKAEAIMIALGANLRSLAFGAYPLCRGFCEDAFAGTWPGSYHPLPMEAAVPPGPGPRRGPDLRDPYGVTGTWLRVVCFLDYTDFYMYNFNSSGGDPPRGVPRNALEAEEATRLILMQIAVTRVEPPGPGDGQGLPVVHFRGFSRSMDDSHDDNANSDLRGTVRLTREGEVRWTTFSLFGGTERWRSESVQVGGVKSAKGVIGNWFDKDYDPRGPAGPTAFWKVSDKTSSTNRLFLPPMMDLSEAYSEDLESDDGDDVEGEGAFSDPPDQIDPDVD